MVNVLEKWAARRRPDARPVGSATGLGSQLNRLLLAFSFANVADGVSLVLFPVITLS
ncbi:hypothetical protein [Streptomyces sp. SA15]|uniref:hypothetical protein n=1 Tax=Streptomyces sp. SA15 TaxID=934019 RepID=UPI0015CCC5D7|nr:hypothetical protein [Streptomyces sp. SA15]